jgi:hypothetical protein
MGTGLGEGEMAECQWFQSRFGGRVSRSPAGVNEPLSKGRYEGKIACQCCNEA